jgi:hypothetical protein
VHLTDTAPTSMILPRANAQPAIANPKNSENRRPDKRSKVTNYYALTALYEPKKDCHAEGDCYAQPASADPLYVENRRLAQGPINYECRKQQQMPGLTAQTLICTSTKQTTFGQEGKNETAGKIKDEMSRALVPSLMGQTPLRRKWTTFFQQTKSHNLSSCVAMIFNWNRGSP